MLTLSEPQFRLASTGAHGPSSLSPTHACKGSEAGCPSGPHGAAVAAAEAGSLAPWLRVSEVPRCFLTPSVLTCTSQKYRVSQSSVGHVSKFSDPEEGVVDPLTYRWSEAQVTTWPCNLGSEVQVAGRIPRYLLGLGPRITFEERGVNWVQGPREGRERADGSHTRLCHLCDQGLRQSRARPPRPRGQAPAGASHVEEAWGGAWPSGAAGSWLGAGEAAGQSSGDATLQEVA